MDYKVFKELGIGFEDGVDIASKFYITIKNTNLEAVSLFKDHNYDLSVIPGAFLKIFTSDKKELGELETVLNRIDEMGMKSLFEKNYQFKYFKREFLDALTVAMKEGKSYLNKDSEFILNPQDVTISNNINKSNIAPSTPNLNDLKSEMDEEDRIVYKDIMERLTVAVKENSSDDALIEVASNLQYKIIAPIIRKEYKYGAGIEEIIESVMFDGLTLSLYDQDRIHAIIKENFEINERKAA